MKPTASILPQLTAQALTLRLEGLAIALAACAAYAAFDGSWTLFAVLILAPDLAMIGYAANRRVGALCYNLAHTYLLPLTLALAGWLLEYPSLLLLGLIWVVHIGLDRAIGYGLKYASSFHDTHLSRV